MKAREWWIDSVSDTLDDCFDAIVYTKDPQVPAQLHVIEKSAYDKAVAALKETTAVIEHIQYLEYLTQGGSTEDWAKRCLEYSTKTLRELGELDGEG